MLKEKRSEESVVPSQTEPDCICCFHFSLDTGEAPSNRNLDGLGRGRGRRPLLRNRSPRVR